jgi:hypothetical protein
VKELEMRELRRQEGSTMKKSMLVVVAMCGPLGVFSSLAAAQEDLAKGFAQPPNAAKPRVYWWWLMSLVSKEGITKDLEEMTAKGIGGVMMISALKSVVGDTGLEPVTPAMSNRVKATP